MVEIDLAKEVLSSFVHADDNVPEENRTAKVTGFNNPDGLAKGPNGRLSIVEDNVPSDIWVAGLDNDHDGRLTRSSSSRLPRSRAEISGIYFGKDPKTLFINVQHPAKALADGTWKISSR